MQTWNLLADMHLETEDTLCQNNNRICGKVFNLYIVKQQLKFVQNNRYIDVATFLS